MAKIAPMPVGAIFLFINVLLFAQDDKIKDVFILKQIK